MTFITVYAVPGRLVRDPRTRDIITAIGNTVPPGDFWHRRLADGDVSLTPPAVVAAPVSEDVADAVDAAPVIEAPASGRRRR